MEAYNKKDINIHVIWLIISYPVRIYVITVQI